MNINKLTAIVEDKTYNEHDRAERVKGIVLHEDNIREILASFNSLPIGMNVDRNPNKIDTIMIANMRLKVHSSNDVPKGEVIIIRESPVTHYPLDKPTNGQAISAGTLKDVLSFGYHIKMHAEAGRLYVHMNREEIRGKEMHMVTQCLPMDAHIERRLDPMLKWMHEELLKKENGDQG